MNDILEQVNILKSKKEKIVYVCGYFNILHPGHLRFLKFAKENGDKLIVAVKQNDNKNKKFIDAKLRLEAVNHSMYVDHAFILDINEIDFIKKLQPDIIVKGGEYEDKYNPEYEVLSEYGGSLIFSSGDIKFSSLSLLNDEIQGIESLSIQKETAFLERHKIYFSDLQKTVEKFKNLNVLVIGDVIVDEYITCEPLGMSQEDPTIVVSPISSHTFLGGAGIVAAHASGLGANVDFMTVIGNDTYCDYVENKLTEYNVKGFIYTDTTRPTTLKQRYRANGKTLLRVNHLKQHHISKQIQNEILKDLEKVIIEKDLIVFSDFSYGCLPQTLIDKIIGLGIKYNKMMVADSQSSSQTGDISRFKDMTLVTPTEREVRTSLNDFESGLVVLVEKLKEKTQNENIFVTLASEGVLITAYENNQLNITEQLPALNKYPKDVAGAGDSLLIASSLALASGANILESAYIGSLAAALQVSRVGNIPMTLDEIKKELEY